MLTLLISLSTVLTYTYFMTYEAAKEKILDVGGEMFTKVVKDVIGFMEMTNTRVKAGEITLAEAQDLVRDYVNGPDQSRQPQTHLQSPPVGSSGWESAGCHEKHTAELSLYPRCTVHQC